MTKENAINQRLYKFAEDNPHQRAVRRMETAVESGREHAEPPPAVSVRSNRQFVLVDAGWIVVSPLPAGCSRSKGNGVEWLATVDDRSGEASSKVNPNVSFARIANAVMRHGAMPPQATRLIAIEAGIDVVLAEAIEESRVCSPPVFDCRREPTGDYLTFKCPGCGKVNRHGSGGKGSPHGDGNGKRSSHCPCALTKYGYILREVSEGETDG
jgi:hypothetical protein